MKKQEYLQLEKLSTLTPAQIKAQLPDLFTRLSERASISLKNTVTERLSSAPKEIKAGLSAIRFTPGGLGAKDVKSLLVSSVLSGNNAPERAKDLQTAVARLPSLGKLDDFLQPDLPVFVNPVFQPEINKARFFRLSEIVGIPEDKTDLALASNLSLDNITNDALDGLVASNVLTSKEAEGLGLVSNLYALVDSNFELAEFIKKKVNPQSLQDLVSLNEADWKNLVTTSSIALPPGINAADYAGILQKKVENIFPEASLAKDITQVNANSITSGLKDLKSLFGLNAQVFSSQRFDELNTKNIAASEVEKLRDQHEAIQRISNLHPGLKLDEVLNDQTLSEAERAKLVTGRIGLFKNFAKNNPSVNFLTLDYRHDSADLGLLNFGGATPAEKNMLIGSVKAYQRVYSFTNDVADTEKILSARFSSAYHVASVTLPEFIQATRLDEAAAYRYYQEARQSIIRSTGAMGAILDHYTGSFDKTAVGNTNPAILDYLRAIPGYDDLFGAMAFCDCADCQSIFSPAAYFVDLMQFIERHVLSKHFTGSKASHVLNLKVRRPDLWSLPLTCENTNGLIPYLQVINEICETYIAKNKGFGGSLSNRSAVEDFVYKQEIALEKPSWKNQVFAFQQPFHMPLASLSIYLGHFDKTRADVAVVLNRPQAEVAKARLGISEKELELITVPETALAFLQQVYGIPFAVSGGNITPLDAQLLLAPMGMDRKQLGKLLAGKFVTSDGTDAIKIVAEKIGPASIQNDIERVKGLTPKALDRAHRFARLWRKTGWTIEELDLVLSQLKSAGIAADINSDAVTAIGTLEFIQKSLKVTVEQLSGIVFGIPEVAINDQSDSLFDVLFNPEDVVEVAGKYPKPAVKFICPSLVIDNSTVPAEFTSDRLMAGLNCADDEILALTAALSSPLGVVNLTSALEADRGFLLTAANLSLLYRHSKISRVLNLSIQDLFRLIRLIPDLPNGYIESTAQIIKVLEFYKWWKSTPYSLDDLNYILESGTIAIPENYLSEVDIAQDLIAQAETAQALLFADTLFTFFTDVTEEQSKAIIQANLAVIEPSPDGTNYWLKPAYNPGTPLVIPAGIGRAEIDLRNLLTLYHPVSIVPFLLAGPLKLSKDLIGLLLAGLGINLDDDAFTLELQKITLPPAALPALIKKLLPISVLFKDTKTSALVLPFVLANLAVFDIADLDHIAIGSIQKVQAFTRYLKFNDAGTNNMANLTAVMAAFSPATLFQTADQAMLAEILQTKVETLAGIHTVAVGPVNAIESLDHYRDIAQLCGYIGVGGDVLSQIVSTNYDDLNAAVQSVLAAFRSKYPVEADRNSRLEPYQDNILSKKRGSLTTYLTHSGFPQFGREDDLFHYFLIDTELEGCARTSRLVAATMSLQLYIHRILLNLEQDSQEPGTPGRLYVLASDIPEDEWDWRKNYRVWEANRKVFLYPENYIEPELRDDKTPLFIELENELLQQEINADTVLDAYGMYMRGFDEVAHLKIAGSYHEKDENTQTDTLHLFGVTPDDPPVYYYRKVENIYYSEKRDDRGIVWGAWTKITVQIPVRLVAPITYNGRLHVFWVQVTSMPNTVFDDNKSLFIGYTHKVAISFTTLKLDGTWTPPQKLNLKACHPFSGNGVILDPLAEKIEIEAITEKLSEIFRSFPFFNLTNLSNEILNLKTPRYDVAPHYEPIDEYTLQGFLWDQIFPSIDSSNRLVLSGMAYQLRAALDFYNLSLQNQGTLISNVSGVEDPASENVYIVGDKPGKIILRSGNAIYRAKSPSMQLFDNFAYGSLIVNTAKSDKLLTRHWNTCTLDNSFDQIRQEQLLTLRSGSTVQVVNGAYSDAIIDAQGDLLLLQGTPIAGNGFILKRIGTTISETLTRTLFTSGVETALSIETQKALKEAAVPITIASSTLVENQVISGKLDYKGAYGTYLREIYFHIPFLIANHLNSQGKYKDAMAWYHYIFNPSANEVITAFAPGLTPAQKKKIEIDRNWQYLEFRNLDVQKLRDQLNDKQAIEVYKKDPFNPHAIARLRLSAYQKTIVMKYIDNLLDWGDQLFSQDTMESVNEATLLYVIAKEILGDRPVEIGECGEEISKPKTYENIQPLLGKSSEFLAELETYTIVRTPGKGLKPGRFVGIDAVAIGEKSQKVAYEARTYKNLPYRASHIGLNQAEIGKLDDAQIKHLPEATIVPADVKRTGSFSVGTTRALDWKKNSIYVNDRFGISSFGGSILKQVSPVFCVPGNKDFLDYFNRVDDRLFKIRNCMNILGQRRQLGLFAPEIDPKLLVRAKAAGLSLDDILNSISGNIPPYRFAYILERAKAFTGVVQSFGASLFSAIEKRDGEDLALLRLTQQQNLLQMSSKSRQLEIDSANKGLEAIQDRIDSLNYQIDYYDGLIAENRNMWEVLQSVGRHTSSIISGIALPLWSLGGIFGLVPQAGSPFAMKYGGVELSGASKGFAAAMDTGAAASEALAASSGLEAGFDRRADGWVHQKKLLKYELSQAQKNLTAAEIRRDLLIEAQKIHERNLEHNQDMLDFYGEKFSNLGLYTYLSATMQRVYKEAYNNALSIARLAEQAYRYERDDDTAFISGNYFDASRGGLLAGETLLMALQSMERRYLETNYRKNEIDQAFSLTQIDPTALIKLKQNATCEFTIPELFFDLFYPGQYRRKIQSVRLTIPSVTGPYVNVSATLSLTRSLIRFEPKLGAAELKDVPKSRVTTIATSTAQNDAGVFQVNFRDDRYMPFEGAGAISSWKLLLPKNFRQFDYDTINDIIIHISYVSEYDELFRDKVEALNDATEGTLLNTLKQKPLARVISLRQEFSADFYRLTAQPVNTPLTLKIQNKHFPLFMNGQTLKVTQAKLVLVTPTGQTAAGLNINFDNSAMTGFASDPLLGGLFSTSMGNLFNAGIIKDHTIAITASGDFTASAPAVGPTPALDKEKLEDILLYLEYKIG